ncbi:MAG: hypothetical protein K0Q89_2243 [Thermomicrobiales bacterium]|nr:hypothetical protein [Thermomicrobiales bacterium]
MLTIWNTRVFYGPSLWAPVPAILLEVDSGELKDRLSKQTPAASPRWIVVGGGRHSVRIFAAGHGWCAVTPRPG